MKALLILITTFTILLAGNGDLHIYTINNKDGNIVPKMLENALKSGGFIIGQNANIQHELLTFFKDNNFKIYTNISFYHKDLTLKLLDKHPDAGVLVPMGIVMYQILGEDDLHIVIASSEMQAKLIGAHPKELKKLEDTILRTITTLFPSATHYYNTKSTSKTGDFLTKYSLDTQGSDFEDVREELEESFEEKFEKAGFSMPSYFNLTKDLGKDSPYDFYVTYAICKLDALKAVAKVKPQTAALGPCTTVVYKKKDEDKIVMAFVSMHSWIHSANITEKEIRKSLLQTQKSYESILKDVTKN